MRDDKIQVLTRRRFRSFGAVGRLNHTSEQGTSLTMTFCAYCYLPSTSTLSKCRKRLFCSRECQSKDWKTGHKLYCGVGGEIDVDFEIRDAGGDVGLGVFALRDFEKNEKIIVERPLLKVPSLTLCYPEIPDCAQKAVDALLPHGGSLRETMDRNSSFLAVLFCNALACLIS
jgi:hypothetical protein